MTARHILFCADTFLRTLNGETPFAGMLPQFRDSAVCLNLETALSGARQKEKTVFLAVDETALDWLPDEVQALTIVNNHAADSGDPQRLATALAKRGKTVIGPQNPSAAHAVIGGISVDFIAAYFALPRLRMSYNGRRANALERLLRDSTAERKIVSLHWGYELTDLPAPFQRQLARRFIDAGADIIIGHHPHVPQGWEVYKDRFIYYSLGNFNFWQFDGENTDKNRWGYMVRYDPGSRETEPIPYRINENYQPWPVPREENAELLLRLRGLCERARTVDTGMWFKTEYADWYNREIKVWSRDCLSRFSPSLWLTWLVWLSMPMNLRYCATVALSRRWHKARNSSR